MLKRLSLYTFLLCLVPLFAWIFSWQWNGDANLTSFDYFLYWITETGSVPYALITCVFFVFLFLPLFPTKTQWISAVLIMVVSMIVTQGIKTAAKTVFAEPRPYVVALTQQSDISEDYFYDQTRDQRAEIVNQFYVDKADVPTWLVKHRANETGYSFPSGHTIFAASWLLLAVGFTQIVGRHPFFTLGMLLWAVLMLVSRLRLGMHHPIDLLVSTLLAWLVHLVLFAIVQSHNTKLEQLVRNLLKKCHINIQ
ncbi:phosphatase PAP2 family protein [Pasteurellaceae bacterium 22721_9_1]